MNQNSHVNKTNFHMKGFALGLALKQRRNATRKSPIASRASLLTPSLPLPLKKRKTKSTVGGRGGAKETLPKGIINWS